MKRDARIGLVVVLVLGLAVTLLIGRAIHKRAELAKDDGEPAAPGGSAQYSAEPSRVDGAEAAQVSSAAAAVPAAQAQQAETAAKPHDAPDPALEKFLQDQTRRMPAAGSPGLLPGEKTAGAEPAVAGAGAKAAPGAAGAPPGSNKPTTGAAPDKAPAGDRSDWLDHESTAAPAADSQPPADGFGYTVVAGDNIWKISTKVYGDGKFTQKIMEANPGLNTQKLKPGMVVHIPLIAHKTILMKLPAFADAKKGLTTPAGAELAKNHNADSSSGPAAAAKNTGTPEKGAGDSAQATVHKVEAGETLSSIARKYFGASGPKTIALLTAANKGLDPAKLKVGQELTIPAKK